MTLKAPFPWFGGKSKVSALVWQALGDVEHYIEPFAGSLAVLLGRPTEPRIETVNDKDHYIVNFWRALQHAPDEVAYYANNPVNEADLTARHIWLVNQGQDRISRILGDPNYYDAKVAGWWVWGICCWIGSGWCSGSGPWSSEDGQLVHLGAGRGVNRQLVHLGAGQGVNRKLVHLGGGSGAMPGVLRSSVHDSADACGIDTGLDNLTAYLTELAARLRYVRVCCGDWKRVVTPGALSHGNPVGVFLDPPYDVDLRGDGLYNHDEVGLSAEVCRWCIANQDNPRYRIVLAGYNGEHDLPGWHVVKWTAGRAYGNANGETDNSENRKLERIWMSPNCITPGKNGLHKQLDMFDDEG